MRDVSEDEFDELLADVEGLILVDFWADWCRPCHVQSPVLEALEREFPQVMFIKVNTEDNRRLAEAFRIRALPTVLLLEPRRPGPGADVLYSGVGVRPRAFWQDALHKALTPRVGLFERIKRLFKGAPDEPDNQTDEPDRAE